ncbi:PqqD family protein [Streptomyces nigra]|uniref:PqqD family protein n=1 Tax=Streptomyces nigra TaxID=1827580 RepID=UPI0036975B32
MTSHPPLTADSVMRRAEDLRIRKFRGALLVARADNTLELDEVAAYIFKKVDGTTKVRTIGEQLAADYDVSAHEATTDAVELLTHLRDTGLVTQVR